MGPPMSAKAIDSFIIGSIEYGDKPVCLDDTALQIVAKALNKVLGNKLPAGANGGQAGGDAVDFYGKQ